MLLQPPLPPQDLDERSLAALMTSHIVIAFILQNRLGLVPRFISCEFFKNNYFSGIGVHFAGSLEDGIKLNMLVSY